MANMANLVIFALLARAEPDAAFAEPDVEESSLARHQRHTHAGDGKQYDYVQQATAATAGSSTMQSSSHLALDKLLRGAGGSGDAQLTELLKMLVQPDGAAKLARPARSETPPSTRPRRKATALPTIEPGMLLGDALSIVESTMGRPDDPGDALRTAAEEAAEEQDEAEEAAAAGGAGDAYIDHLDEAGLQQLHSAVQARLRRIRAAWTTLERRRAAGSVGAGGGAAAAVRGGDQPGSWALPAAAKARERWGSEEEEESVLAYSRRLAREGAANAGGAAGGRGSVLSRLEAALGQEVTVLDEDEVEIMGEEFLLKSEHKLTLHAAMEEARRVIQDNGEVEIAFILPNGQKIQLVGDGASEADDSGDPVDEDD